MLRVAREALGMSTATLAGRLRLHVKQIEALERGDLNALPRLIYVRGFLRGCARELKIDPAPLIAELDRMTGAADSATPEPSGNGFPSVRLGDGTKPVVAIALVVLLVAGVVGTLLPRNKPAPPATVVRPLPPPDPNAAPKQDAAPPATPESTNAPVAVAAANPSPPPPAAAPSVATTPPSGGRLPSAAAPAPAAPPAAVRSAQPAPPAAPGADLPVLVLRAKADAWVEVIQSNGTTLLSQICTAGSVVNVKGAAPLRLVIGNAGAVEAQYRGATVDLRRHVNPNGVARLTLD